MKGHRGLKKGMTVRLDWSDPAGDSNRWDFDVPDYTRPVFCKTWGRILLVDKEFVVIASTVCPNTGAHNDRVAIPKGCILNWREIPS